MKKTLLSLACAVSLGFTAGAQTYEATPFADLQTGDVVVIVDQNGSYAIPNAQAAKKGSVTVSTVTLGDDNNTVTATDIDALTFTVTKTDDGLKFTSTADAANDLYCENDNSGMRVSSTDADNVFVMEDGFLKNVGQARYVGVYSNKDWRCYTSIHANIKNTKIAFYKETATASTVYKPTFSPAAGEYYEAQSVTISCATEDATLEYSFDNATWTAYNGPVTVDKSLTLYARATKNGVTAESSAAYVIKTLAKYASIAEMMAMDLPAKGAKSDVFVVNFDATVVYQNGAYTYLYDGKDYALYYLNNSGLEKGNTLAAGWRAQISNYNNLYELIPVTTPEKGENVTTFPEPEVVEPAALVAENQAKYITLRKVVLEAATPEDASAFTGKMGDATVDFYNRFKLASVEAGTYDITGFIAVYNTTVQVYVVSIDEPADDPEPEPVIAGSITVAEDAPFVAKIDWSYRDATPNTGANTNQRGATGTPSGDVIYEVEGPTNSINKITKDGKTQFMTGLPGITPFDITSDYAGNLIMIPGGGGAGLGKVWILPAGKTSVDDLVYIEYDYTETGATSNKRVDRLGRVLGDVMSEEGGLLYYATDGLNYSVVVKIANGEYVEGGTSVESPAALNSFWLAVPWATNMEEAIDASGDDIGTLAGMCYLYQANGGKVYGPNEDFDDWVSFNAVKTGTTYAFDWFMMNGKQYFIYGNKATDADSKAETAGYVSGSFQIIDAETSAVVAKFECDFAGASGQVWGSVQAWPQADGSVKITNWNGRSGAEVLTVIPKITPLYAVYDGQGWNPAEPVEFAYADGIYSYTFAEGAGKFKMSTTKGADANDWTGFETGVICVADDKVIEDNSGETKYALYVGGNADINFGYAEGQWTAYVDLANGLIWATNATDKPADSGSLYIVGIKGSFDAVNPTEFVYDEAKKVFTVEVPAAPYGFKLSTEKGGWDKFDAAGFHTNGAIAPNVPTDLLAGSPAGGANMSTTATTPYTIEVAADYSTITIVKEEQINVPESLAVIGELAAGQWNPTVVGVLTLQSDGYTYSGEVEMAGGWFSLCEHAAATAGDWGGIGTRYGALKNGAEVTKEVPIAFQQGENAFNIVSFASYPMGVIFTVDFKEMTVMVKQGTNGVEAIDADNNAAVEYYNLQGIRINEPVKGQLYIVRKGSEVSKIVL